METITWSLATSGGAGSPKHSIMLDEYLGAGTNPWHSATEFGLHPSVDDDGLRAEEFAPTTTGSSIMIEIDESGAPVVVTAAIQQTDRSMRIHGAAWH